MKNKLITCLAVMALCAIASVNAAVPQALTYRGVLLRPGGETRAEALEMTFRLYDSNEPDKALWARLLRVPIDTNGVFYAELTDAEGSDPDGIGRSLVDAISAVRGTPEIGLTPPNATELKPRQRLSTGVRAARAARADAADVMLAPAGAVAQGVAVDTAVVGSVTVLTNAQFVSFPSDCTLTRVQDRELGGGENSSIKVRNVTVSRPNWPTHFNQEGFRYVTESAPCDMFLTYDGPDGAFNVIVPAGGRIKEGGSTAQTVYGTAFGNP